MASLNGTVQFSFQMKTDSIWGPSNLISRTSFSVCDTFSPTAPRVLFDGVEFSVFAGVDGVDYDSDRGPNESKGQVAGSCR